MAVLGEEGRRGLEAVARELRRKSIHMIPGFFAIPFIYWLGRPVAAAVSLLFLTLYLLHELSMRGVLKLRVPIAYHTYMLMARDWELETGTFIGPVYFWSVATAAIILLPAKAAAAAIMVSSFGDAAAALTGRLVKGPRNPLNPRKTIAGSVAMLSASTCSCLLAGLSPAASLLVAVAATLVEAATRRDVDDEYTVPIAAAITALLALKLHI